MIARKQTRTVVTLEALFRAVLAVWPEAEIRDIAILFGKLIAECGWPNDKQACWNWNVGNIRGTSPAGNYTILGRAYEIVRAGAIPAGWYEVPNTFGASVPAGMVCVLPLAPSEAQRFRAYDSLEEAIRDYFALLERAYRSKLVKGATVRGAWEVLQDEGSTVEDFILALKAGFYFTGDATAYIRNALAGFDSAMPLLARMTRPQPPAPAREAWAPFGWSGPATPLLWERPEAEHTIRLTPQEDE